jgi:hypothetical protein
MNFTPEQIIQAFVYFLGIGAMYGGIATKLSAQDKAQTQMRMDFDQRLIEIRQDFKQRNDEQRADLVSHRARVHELATQYHQLTSQVIAALGELNRR